MKTIKPWVPVPGFSKYEVNADRELRNSKGDNISQKNKSGKYYITKDDGGKKLISMDEIMELVGDDVNGCLVDTAKLNGPTYSNAKIEKGEKVIPAKSIKKPTGKNQTKLKPGVKKQLKEIKKAVKAATKKVENNVRKFLKDPKASLTHLQIKKILDTIEITAEIASNVENVLNTQEPKHAKCYRLNLLGIKNKTISELTNTPAPAVGRNIWFYTSGQYELN